MTVQKENKQVFFYMVIWIIVALNFTKAVSIGEWE